MKKILADNLFAAFFALCAVMLAESMLLRLAGYHAPLAVGIASLASILVTLLFSLNRKNVALYIGTVAILLLALWALHTTEVDTLAVFARVSNRFLGGETLSIGETVLVVSVLSLLLSAILLPASRLLVVRYCSAIATVGMLVGFGIRGISGSFVEVFAAAGILLCVPTELCLSMRYRGESRKMQTAVLSFLLPLFLLFSCGVALLPSAQEPIRWRLVTRVATQIANTAESIAADVRLWLHSDNSEFQIGMRGYSDENGSVFGNALSGGEKSQLLLSGKSRLRGSVYLIGNVSDTYTGDGWEKSGTGTFSENDAYLDYCETMLAFARAGYGKEDVYDFSSRTTLTVQYDDIITKTLFYPLKTPRLSGTGRYDATTASMVRKKRAKRGEEYSLTLFEISYHDPRVEQILHTPFSYASMPVGSARELDSEIPLDVGETLAKRADYIAAAFTALPDSITQRTRDLADSITKNCTDTYDKLRALEAYLRGYAYTLSPGGVPAGQDPVDFFLFESGTGYCTYFASAMAVLARCEGIPVRYVQGFSVDCANDSPLSNYPVYGSNAHAWVEAYFPGTGWIPFEPTASYGESRYDFAGKPISSLNPYDRSDFTYPEIVTPNNPAESPAAGASQNNVTGYVLLIAACLLGLCCILALYVAIRLRLFRLRYHSSADTARFLCCYRMTLFLCEKNRCARLTGETAVCYAERLSALWEEKDDSLLEITAVFDKIRDGGGVALPADCARAEAYLLQVLAEETKTHGRRAVRIPLVGYCLVSAHCFPPLLFIIPLLWRLVYI